MDLEDEGSSLVRDINFLCRIFGLLPRNHFFILFFKYISCKVRNFLIFELIGLQIALRN